MRRARTCIATSYAAAGGAVTDTNVLHAAGPNGGTMRGDSIGAMWPTLQIIRDNITDAAEGRTLLTYIMLWDVYMAYRLAAYKRISFKVS